MSALALKHEATTLVNRLPEYKLRYAIQFLRFIEQQPAEAENDSDSALEAARAARDRHDMEWINANAERLNAEVEETLEFQADIWEDE